MKKYRITPCFSIEIYAKDENKAIEKAKNDLCSMGEAWFKHGCLPVVWECQNLSPAPPKLIYDATNALAV